MLTRDEIIRMAREADIDWHKHWNDDETNRLERFAALVAAAEREAAARMFDGPVWSYDYREIAAAIRARSKQ